MIGAELSAPFIISLLVVVYYIGWGYLEFSTPRETHKMYPRPKKSKVEKSKRPWRVDYALNYDYGEGQWFAYYRSPVTARICAWWHVRVGSSGGTAHLVRQTND